jgi:uncharacterized Fe-S center protein
MKTLLVTYSKIKKLVVGQELEIKVDDSFLDDDFSNDIIIEKLKEKEEESKVIFTNTLNISPFAVNVNLLIQSLDTISKKSTEPLIQQIALEGLNEAGNYNSLYKIEDVVFIE